MNDPEYRKARSEANLLRRRGITREQRDAIFDAQDRRCAVCGTSSVPDGNRGWHIDHCHKTHKVRGILCGNCNNALGFLRESLASAEAMVAYIRDRCATSSR